MGLKKVSHEDLSRHHGVDWLKAYEANFSRAKTLETADLTEVAVLTPRLENATDKTRESAPPVIKQIWRNS